MSSREKRLVIFLSLIYTLGIWFLIQPWFIRRTWEDGPGLVVTDTSRNMPAVVVVV